MAEKKRSFNVKVYALCSVITVAVLLVLICVTAFTSRYTAFSSEKTAVAFAETIVQTGDGYNAYKNTLVSKNVKYGDFIRKNYIEPVIYRDVEGYYPGDSTEGLKGYNDESYKGEKTLSDDGTLSGKLTQEMYAIYNDLVITFGWDEYHKIFKAYAEKLVGVRRDIFGDDYMSDEVFFTAFEANVSAYGKTLTGTQDVFDENTGVQLSEKKTGIYEEVFGSDYTLSVKAILETDLDIQEYKNGIDTETFSLYSVNADDISQARKVTVGVFLDDGTELTSVQIVVVKIGMSWYVDNAATDTDALYNFYVK